MTTFNTRLIRLTAVILAGVSLLACRSDYEFAYLYEDLPFEMEEVRRPQIPSREVNIKDFGGVGDGVFLNTEAFASAIDALYEAGGGRLVVPTGIWLTGPVTLKDNIDLHIRPDAVLLFSTDRDLYPIVETVFEGLDTKRCLAPINADGAKNIAITGERLNAKTEELLYGSEYQSFLNYETYVKLSKEYPPKEVEEALRVASIFLEVKNLKKSLPLTGQ